MTTNHETPRSIDDYLGPAQGRFFGHGFRRIGHRVTDVQVSASGVTATAALHYPDDWSRKSAGTLRAHLSSVDALVLAVGLAEAHLTHVHELDSVQRQRMWLRSFTMRGGNAPQEDLQAVAVGASFAGCTPAPELGGYISAFSCRIGTLTVTCEVGHELRGRIARAATYATLPELLGPPADRYWGDGFRDRRQHINDVAIAPDGRTIEAALTLSPGGRSDSASGFGLGGADERAPSMIDGLVSLAQLAQVLAYRLDGIERGASHTLWMRRLAQATPAPPRPADGPVRAALALRRTSVLPFGGGLWRTLDVAGELHGISVTSSIAHELPSETLLSPPARRRPQTHPSTTALRRAA